MELTKIEQIVAMKTQTAVDFWFEEKYEKTLAGLEIVFELNPNFIRAHNLKALALAGLGRYEESFAAVRQSFEIDPDSGITYSVLGSCLTKAGRHDEAETAFARGIRLSGDSPIPYYNYACFLASSGELEKSFEMLKEAHRLHPESVDGLLLTDADLRPLIETEWFKRKYKELK